MIDFTKLGLPPTTATDKQQLILASSAILATGLGFYYLISSAKHRNKTGGGSYREIPTPGSQLPWFGHLLSLGELPGQKVTEWNEKYGPIIQLKMGVQKWVLISDPFIAHEVFVTHGASTSNRPPHTYYDYYSYGRRGIACSDVNKRWKKARTAALSVLAPQRVNQLTDLLVFEADDFVKKLLAHEQVDPAPFLQSAALNVILTTCFARRVNSVDDPLFNEIMNYVHVSMKLAGAEGDLSQFLPIMYYMDTLVGKRRMYTEFIKNVRDPLFAKLIQEATAGDDDCLIKSFIALKDEYELEDKDILVIFSDLLGAGADTTSVSLSWMFVILSHYPDVQKKVMQEIDEFIAAHGRLPSFDERDQLPFVNAVQRECMRFRPTSFFGLPHVSTEDVVVRDYYIPKGTVLVANMLGMHHNAEIYSQPEKFKPERFLNNTRTMSASANGNIHQRDHYNFGWGRRICPGIHLAEVEMFLIFTRVFAYSSIAPPLDSNGKEVPVDLDAADNAGLVVLPKPYEVRFLRRNNSILPSL